MRMRLSFTLYSREECMRTNNNTDECTSYDGENFCVYSEIPGYDGFVSIILDKRLFEAVNRSSDESIKKTRKNLKEAVKETIRNNKWQGVFTLFLDKGAFDIGG